MIALGDHDEIIVLDQIKEMAQLIPHGHLTVFKDASHFVMWQDPDELQQGARRSSSTVRRTDPVWLVACQSRAT